MLNVKRVAVLLVLGLVVYLHRLQPVHWSQLETQIFHSLHGPGFALLAIGVFFALPAHLQGWRRLAVAGLSSMAIGVVTELLQIPGGRDAELRDITMNAIGVVAGLSLVVCFLPSFRKLLSRTGLIVLTVVGIGALTGAFAETVRSASIYAMQRAASPTLLSFEHDWENRYFGQCEHIDPQLVDTPQNWLAPGQTVFKAREHGRHGALFFARPLKDWTDFSALSFVIASANDNEHEIMVSIRQMRDRGERQPQPYAEILTISAEARRHTIRFADILKSADHKQFDLSLVESIVISSATPGSDAFILLDDFRLD